MKILTLTFFLVLGTVLMSCDKTSKETSKSPDTMVLKKDTAIKRTDTAGFHK